MKLFLVRHFVIFGIATLFSMSVFAQSATDQMVDNTDNSVESWYFSSPFRNGFYYGTSQSDGSFTDSTGSGTTRFSDKLHHFAYLRSNASIGLDFGTVRSTATEQDLSVLHVALERNSGEFAWRDIHGFPVTLSIPLGIAARYISATSSGDSEGEVSHHIGMVGLNAGIKLNARISVPQIKQYVGGFELIVHRSLAPSVLSDFGVDAADVRMAKSTGSEVRFTIWNPLRTKLGLSISFDYGRGLQMQEGAQVATFLESVFSSKEMSDFFDDSRVRFGLVF